MERSIKMWKEFKEFIMQGNVLDLAIGVVMGASFTAIVTALVDHVITPIIAALTGNATIDEWTIAIGPAQLGIGAFLQAVLDFFIIAVILFLIIKAVNSVTSKFKTGEEEEELTAEDYLAEIRDLLKEENPYFISAESTIDSADNVPNHSKKQNNY